MMFRRAVVASLACILTLGAVQSYAEVAAGTQKTLIVMGGSSLALRNSTKQDAEVAFNAVLDEAIVNPDMKLHVSVYSTTEEIYAAFDKGEIDGIFGSPLEFIGRMDQLGEESMALSYKSGAVKQNFVLITRADATKVQLSDLRNKRLSLAKFQDVEALYLNTLLLRNQLGEIPEFFSLRLDAKNANVAIMDVFFGKSDAAVVRESEFLTAIELNPQIGKRLMVLDKSVPCLPALGAVRKTLDREKVKNLMLDIERVSDNRRGGKILTLTQANSIVRISREEMHSVLDMMKEYETLKKMNVRAVAATPQPKARERRHAR